jgi:hypothetical protein
MLYEVDVYSVEVLVTELKETFASTVLQFTSYTSLSIFGCSLPPQESLGLHTETDHDRHISRSLLLNVLDHQLIIFDVM